LGGRKRKRVVKRNGLQKKRRWHGGKKRVLKIHAYSKRGGGLEGKQGG